MSARRAVVIGAGFGGLASAIRLQAAGVHTTLVEKRDRPGGRAYVYADAGHRFDAGPTVITGPNTLEELFEISGRRLEDYVTLVPVKPFYRLIWPDGNTFDYDNDEDALIERIREKSPGDVAGYHDFVRHAEKVFAEGYERLAHVPFLDIWSMVRVAPQLVHLESYRSVYSIVARHLRDPQLRQAFSFHSLLVGGNPFVSSSIYTLIHVLEKRWGVFFPMGGTGALVEGLAKLFQDIGGELLLDAPVERIDTTGARVRGVVLEDGREIAGDAVVSNADVVHTYRHLLEREPLAKRTGSRLLRRRYSNSLFVVYFGTRGDYPDLAHHTVLFGPRYRELLADIFDRGILAEDFSLYLHAPTVTDPSLAPPGGGSYYALSPVPHLGKAPLDWSVEGPRYRDRILEYLEERLMPGLREQITTMRIFTPNDFETELNAHLGSAFSLEPVLTQSAWFRVHNRDPRVGGLYFAGAGTHPGAGIPGVVNSAKATAGLVLDDLGVGRGAAAGG